MAKNKTIETEASVEDFIESFVEKDKKKADAYRLLKLMQEWSGFTPKMWGPSIIGFGSYHYKYASGHEGDAPILGFSPRKAAISLYVFVDTEENRRLLTELGKFKMGKACMYVNKLADIDLSVLEKICLGTIAYLEEHPECTCHSS